MQILKEAMSAAGPSTSREKPETASEPSTSKEMPKTASESSSSTDEELLQSPEPTPHEETTSIFLVFSSTPAESCDVMSGCVNCAQLLKENRQLANRVKTLREIVGKRREEVKVYRRKCKNKNDFVLDPSSMAHYDCGKITMQTPKLCLHFRTGKNS